METSAAASYAVTNPQQPFDPKNEVGMLEASQLNTELPSNVLGRHTDVRLSPNVRQRTFCLERVNQMLTGSQKGHDQCPTSALQLKPN